MSWLYSDPFAGVEKQIAAMAQRVCEETAALVLRDAQAGAPVDKGALAASGHIVTPHESGAPDAKAAALAANPKAAMSEPLVIDDWSDEGVAQAWIDFLASYAVFVAHGRHGKAGFVPGRDFLGAALSRNRAAFLARGQRELDAISTK